MPATATGENIRLWDGAAREFDALLAQPSFQVGE
jgi:hypothetical protein